MNNIKICFSIATNNIRKWSANPRIYVLLILMVMFAWHYVSPYVSAAKALGYRVTPWIFPHMINFSTLQRYIMLGLILLFCDAPFMDNTQPYVIIRSKKTTWAIGQIIYIALATAIYLITLVCLCIIVLLPVMYFSDGWGKILTTFANSNAGSQFRIEYVSYRIVSSYSPIQAMILSLILEWVVGILLGLVMFATNMYFKRGVGAIVAITIVMFDTFIDFGSVYVSKFSPVSFPRLGIIDSSGISNKPSPAYICAFFIISIAVLIFMSIHSIKRKSLEVQKMI